MNPFGPTVVAAATAVALYVYLQWKRSINKAIPGIPFLPPSFPFGNLSLFAKLGQVGAFDEALKLGPVAGMWFFAREWLLIRHHEDVKTVFVSSVFRDANPVEQLHNEAFPGRKAIVYLMDDEWKVHRTAMNKAFHVVDLKGMVTTFASVGGRLCDYLAQCAASHSVIDLVPTLKAATIDVVGITGFGYDFKAVDSLKSGKVPFAVHEFQWLQAELVRRTFSMNPLLRFYWLPTAANREHARCRAVVRGLVSNIVAHRMQSTTGSGTHEDLLQHMLEAAREDKSGLITEESLTDSLMTLVFAGFDTTSLALSFASYLLTQHPGVLSKLRAELDRELPSDVTQVTAEVVGRLRYTRAVLEESMRLFPPVPVTARTLTQEITLSNGVTVPSGVKFIISSHAVHHDQHNWPQPDVFNPDRFFIPLDSPDGLPVAGKYPAAAFIPFSMGRRDCAGRNMAVLEGTTLLALLHSRFDFTLARDYTFAAETAGFVQVPKGGLHLQVSLRK